MFEERSDRVRLLPGSAGSLPGSTDTPLYRPRSMPPRSRRADTGSASRTSGTLEPAPSLPVAPPMPADAPCASDEAAGCREA